MPQLIAGPIFTFLISSTAIATTLAGPLATALGYAIFAGGAYLANSLLAPDRPKVPDPDDGSYNLKQPIPALSYVLGRVKKGGDYAFLEEKNGTAYHIMVWACHRIEGYVRHYLHDEKVTLDDNGGVTQPAHFYKPGVTVPGFPPPPGKSYVRILARLGEDASTAYSQVTSQFPTIWTSAYRGDGLATVLMMAKGASSEDFMKVFPNNMPEHSAVGDGALLYDPRKDSTEGGSGSHRHNNPNTWEFSTNLALMRLWHLCHPVGGKMAYGDMYLPDWMNAANVADQNVTNRSGGTEKRYHGGFWFRANNDPTEVGRIIDEAAELVVYERPDGKIGVHAGEYLAPDVRLTAKSIFSIQVDKNRRRANTVMAVRGRWTNPEKDYIAEDAAIFGSPYGVVDDSTERTRTFENSAIQSHNHCARKQKLTYIRANARRISIVADYTADNLRLLSARRFVRVHYPERGLVEATVEITSSVQIDLRNMRVSFSGIIVPTTLYAFNAAIEEGAPGEVAEPAPESGVPTPDNFVASIANEVVAGGGTAAFCNATWSLVDDELNYELEWEPTDLSDPPRSSFSVAGKTVLRSAYLADGKQYRFRLRAWGGGSSSDWTDYQTLTATADPVAPGVVTGASIVGGAGQVTFNWTAPNSSNYFAARLYLNTTNSMTGAVLAATEYGAPAAADSRVVTGLSAGVRYGFIVAINASGVAASAVATGSATVT